jgi:hypothetical protein
MSTLVADTRNVFQREMSLVLRDPFSVIFSLVQPLVFLGLFGPLLAGYWIRPRSVARRRCSGSCRASS